MRATELHWETLSALFERADGDAERQQYAESMLGVALSLPDSAELASRKLLSDLAPSNSELSRTILGFSPASDDRVRRHCWAAIVADSALSNEEEVVWKTWLTALSQSQVLPHGAVERYREACVLDPNDLRLRLALRDVYFGLELAEDATAVWLDAYSDLTTDFSLEQTELVRHLLTFNQGLCGSRHYSNGVDGPRIAIPGGPVSEHRRFR